MSSRTKHRVLRATKLTFGGVGGLHEGSAVTRGANQHADIVLFKSGAGAPEQRSKETDMPDKTEMEKLADSVAKSDKRISELETALKAKDEQIAKTEADLRAREKDLADLKQDHEREVAKNADPMDTILKGMSKEARDLFLAEKAQNERLQKRLAADDDARAIEKAGSEFVTEYPALPIKADEVGPIMKKVVGALDEDETKELRRLLKAGSDALDTLTKLQGMTAAHGGAPDSADAELDTLAKARAAKDGISFAKAYTAILEENPALYTKSVGERNEARH